MAINHIDGVTIDTNESTVIEWLEATSAITAGDVVVADDAKTGEDWLKYVKVEATAAGHLGNIRGVAGATVASGALCPVVVQGYAGTCTCTSATYAAGAELKLANAGDAVAYGSTALIDPPFAFVVTGGSTVTSIGVVVLPKYRTRA